MDSEEQVTEKTNMEGHRADIVISHGRGLATLGWGLYHTLQGSSHPQTLIPQPWFSQALGLLHDKPILGLSHPRISPQKASWTCS